MSHINFSTQNAIIIFEMAEKLGYEPNLVHVNKIIMENNRYTNFHLNVELMYWGFEIIGVKGCFSYSDIDILNEMYNNWIEEYEEEIEISQYDKVGAILDNYDKYNF
jgi:hypothetical protein